MEAVRERERETDRNIDAREKHCLVASHMHPNWGSNPQPLWCTARRSNELSHTAKALCLVCSFVPGGLSLPTASR